jgi:hypothetical protein
MKGQFAFGSFDAFSRCTLFFAIATEGTIDLNEQADGLVVIGLNLSRAFEKRRRTLQFAFGKTGSSIKLVSFE